MCAILHQLFSQNAALFESQALPELKIHGKGIIKDCEALWTLFLHSGPKAGKVICVFDGLDECKTDDRNWLVSKIDDFFHKRCTESKADPNPLKFLLTSRPYHNVIRPFRDIFSKCPTVKLDGAQETKIGVEIESVIRSELAKHGDHLGLKGHHVQIATETILAYRNRTYLWAKFILKEITEQLTATPEQFLQLVRQLPSSVEEAYERILEKCDNRGLAVRILGWVVAARRPLRLDEMDVMLALYDRQTSSSYADLRRDFVGSKARAEQVQKYCGLFVNVIESKLYLIHQTALEFLVCSKYQASLGGTWKHCIVTSRAHAALAESCMRFLMLPEFAAPPSEPDTSEYERHQYAFYDYANDEWASHFSASRAKSTDLLLPLALDVYESWNCQRLVYKSPPATRQPGPKYVPGTRYYPIVNNIIELACYNRHFVVLKHMVLAKFTVPAISQALSLACRLGRADVVRYLAEHADVNFAGDDKFTALHAATYLGDRDSVKALLEAGASVDQLGGPRLESLTALHIAIEKKHWIIVSLLLQHGANVNARGGRFGSPLHAAMSCDKCDWDSVALLLEQGANVDCMDHDGDTALHLASRHVEPDIGLLLDWGANINSRNDDGATPLCIAVWRENFDMVRSILAINEAQVWCKDFNNECALEYAVYQGSETMVHILLDCERLASDFSSRALDTQGSVLQGIAAFHHTLFPKALERFQCKRADEDAAIRAAFDCGLKALDCSTHAGLGYDLDSLLHRCGLIMLVIAKPEIGLATDQRSKDIIQRYDRLLEQELELYDPYCPSCHLNGTRFYLYDRDRQCGEVERPQHGHALRFVNTPRYLQHDDRLNCVRWAIETEDTGIGLRLSTEAQERVSSAIEHEERELA